MAKTIQQMKRIEAPSVEDFVELFNDTMAELADLDPKAISIGEKDAVIVYNERMNNERHCCECAIYDWGRGCSYREGRVKLMDAACINFTVTLK